MAEPAVPSRTPPAPPAAVPGDRNAARLGLFVSVLVLALVGGFGLGRSTASPAVQPVPAGAPGDHTHAPGTTEHAHDDTAGAPATVGGEVGGLAVSAGGFTLVPQRTTFVAGVAAPLRFTVDGPDGQPVQSYATVHDKQLHLIVVRRDLTGYQHLHPVLAPDGTWSVDLRVPSAGPWRAYADFTVADAAGGSRAVTLGVDLVVAGQYAPKALADPVGTASTGDFLVGYQGTLRVGATQPLLFRVTRAGAAATLERYLGAYGHLVMLREGDLGYVHVHPEPELAGDAVKFWAAAPSPGRYRMFLDFQVAGAVHTAEFTMLVR